MAIDEAARLHLYERARDAWGDEAASTLMHALPRDPDRFATKDDVAVLGADLRTEIAELRGDLRTEIAELRTDLRTEIAEVRGEIKASAADTVRTLMFGMIASNATLVGLVFAAAKLA